MKKACMTHNIAFRYHHERTCLCKTVRHHWHGRSNRCVLRNWRRYQQDEKIDAFFYTVGHPNGNIKEATSGRIKVKIIPIEGEGIDAVLAKVPYYAKAVIPHKFYPSAENEGDVESIGVKATFVASKNLDQNIVYAITKEVFDNLDDFKKLHPAYAVLTKGNMLKGLSAPIHEGALKYYRETGLVKHIDPKLIP